MASYPTISSVAYVSPIVKKIHTRSIIKAYASGIETAKRVWDYPRRDFSISYKNITLAEAKILWQSFLDQYGQYEPIAYFDSAVDTYTKEFVVVADGETYNYNLPSLEASSYTVYVNNIAQQAGINYDFDPVGGGEGADQLEMIDLLSEGDLVTFSFTGQLKVWCRFAEDDISFQQFYTKLVTCGIKLRGLIHQQ